MGFISRRFCLNIDSSGGRSAPCPVERVGFCVINLRDGRERADICGMFALALLGGSLGGGEIMMVLLVALLLFGSKNLPQIARTLGKTLEQIRRAANDVKDEVMKAELEEEEKPVEQTAKAVTEEPKLPVPRPPEENADDRVAR